MPTPLMTLLGVIILITAIQGLWRGKVIAGARGLRSHYYSKTDNPWCFYGFVLIYLSIGSFLLYQSIY